MRNKNLMLATRYHNVEGIEGFWERKRGLAQQWAAAVALTASKKKGVNWDDVRVVSASSSFFLLILSLRVSASRRDC